MSYQAIKRHGKNLKGVLQSEKSQLEKAISHMIPTTGQFQKRQNHGDSKKISDGPVFGKKNEDLEHYFQDFQGFSGGTSGKELTCQCRLEVKDAGSISGSGRSLGGGRSNPLQYSRLENPMDRGDWWAAFHKVSQSWT